MCVASPAGDFAFALLWFPVRNVLSAPPGSDVHSSVLPEKSSMTFVVSARELNLEFEASKSQLRTSSCPSSPCEVGWKNESDAAG